MPFLAAAAVVAASYGSGMAITLGGRVGIDDGLRRRLTVFALGFGLLALLVFGLGLVNAFTRPALATVALVGAALVLPFVPAEARAARAAWRESGPTRWLLVAAAAILALDIVLASAPPTSGDAIAYHLVGPKVWLEAGHIYPIWWNWTTFQPFSTEMHFALAQALEGGRAAMVVAAVLDVFSVACVYGFTRELAGQRAAAVAALVWVAQGMFLWEATGGFVELVLSGFVVLSAWHLVALRQSRRLQDAAWAGFAAGLAIGVKYHGLIFLPVFALLAGVLAGNPLRRRGLAAGAFLALALVGVPWYLRNWIVAGNPLYPFAAGTFGGKYLDAASLYDLHQSLGGFGLHGIWRLPFFPLEFLLHHNAYERGYSFSPALFLLPPVALLLGGRTARLLGLGLLVYVVLWWESLHQVTRYLLPVLPFAAALAGWAAVALWDRRGAARGYVVAVAAITVVPLVAITGLFTWRIAPGALGFESEGHFVQRLTGTYHAFNWLDEELPPKGRVLVGIRDLYYLDRPNATFDIPIFNFGPPSEHAVARMRQYDIRYLAFVGGKLPPSLMPISRQLRVRARLDIPFVTSRTLGHVQHVQLVVWEWCAARGDPCGLKHAR
ncbi:MAG TPA: glycosyltransferase family 39 protein [Gaiellaceae bacterium]